MQTHELLVLAIISAALQVAIQFFGALKAFFDFMASRKTEKDSDRRKRSKSRDSGRRKRRKSRR